jgi:hypothetical protein
MASNTLNGKVLSVARSTQDERRPADRSVRLHNTRRSPTPHRCATKQKNPTKQDQRSEIRLHLQRVSL